MFSPKLIIIINIIASLKVFSGDSVVKNLPANTGVSGSIPGSGSSPGDGNGNPLQNSYLGNPMDKGAWRATVHGVRVTRIRHDLMTKPPMSSITTEDFIPFWNHI